MDFFINGMIDMTFSRTSVQLSIVCFVIMAVLLPFAGKAFHLDDPLFIWTGQQLQQHPLDFYGFPINWYGTVQPMATVMKNPPLFAYYLALAGCLGGWNEYALHLACIVPALAVGTGTWLLARELTDQPLLATLAGILTPVFILSATTVMCDVLLTAFWVWAVYFWIRDRTAVNPRHLVVSALLIAAAALTKYYGVSLILLLALHSLAEGLSGRKKIPYLLIPGALLICYQFWTMHLYGGGLLTDAARYSTSTRHLTPAGVAAALVTGLSYTGGGLLPTLLCTPQRWGKRFLPVMAGLLTTALILISVPTDLNGYQPALVNGKWLQAGQLFLFVTAGLAVLATAVEEYRQRRDNSSLLLGAWVIGTFLFACCFNWTVSGRNILPMAPAVGILIVRSISLPEGPLTLGKAAAPVAAMVLSLLISLAAVLSDTSVAATARQAATAITDRYGQKSVRLYFQGHWGFQYYMQRLGALPIDFNNAALAEGDIMVMPSYGTNIRFATTEGFILVDSVSPPLVAGVSTIDARIGAGFYLSQKAALPYAFGTVSPIRYEVYLFKPGNRAVTAN